MSSGSELPFVITRLTEASQAHRRADLRVDRSHVVELAVTGCFSAECLQVDDDGDVRPLRSGP